MKNLFLLVVTLMFASCSTYYGSTMNTKDSFTIKNDNGEFVVEGDSLDVIYNFFGENAPVSIGVVNKMSKPLYIDWSKSGIMIDGMPVMYVQSAKTSNENNSQLINFTYFLDNSDDLSYIKPYSRLNKQILELTNFNFQEIDDSLYQNWNTEADSWGENKRYSTIRYIENNSPIYFRAFLTIYEDSQSVEDAFYYENYFYMSELIKLKGSSPKNIAAFRQGRGDFFFVKEKRESKPPKKNKNKPTIFNKVTTVTEQLKHWAVEGSKVEKSGQQKKTE